MMERTTAQQQQQQQQHGFENWVIQEVFFNLKNSYCCHFLLQMFAAFDAFKSKLIY